MGAVFSLVDSADHRRVLFVDDERAHRNAFSRIVGRAGFDVECAENAEEAVRICARERFPVVVTDLRMPGRDGMSLIRQLERDHPETTFVVSTGVPDLDLGLEHDIDAAISATIGKPWEQQELVDVVSRAHALAMTRQQLGLEVSSGGILIVEDNPWDADLLREYVSELTSDTVPVVHATRLDEALELLERGDFSAILTDLTLPDGRGFDSVTRLHRARPELPIVVMTGHNDENMAEYSLRYGAQDFLVKGRCDQHAVLRAIRHATERKRVEQRLSYLATHDELTGLANRKSFRERFANAAMRARRRKESFALLLVDLDNFKQVNDHMGHAVGDAVLRFVADQISACVRELDVAARLGGDEFAILADAPVDPFGLESLGTRLMTFLREPLRVNGGELSVTASIGAALYPWGGETFEDLIKTADASMYAAKREGRDRIVIAKTARSASPNLPGMLEGALDRDEFVLDYQPQFDLTDRSLQGFEALVRWERDDTRIPPDAFVPLLEESGMIVELGRWILDQACKTLRAWNDAHDAAGRMAVNVSPRQFESRTLAADVDEVLARYALSPDSLEVEITESLLMRDTSWTKSTLNELKEIGVRIAIDDFGTGYSSLAYLNRFSVDVLKIDRSFVRNLDRVEGKDAKIVQAVVGLAHTLGLDVIAEGIETQAQLDQLCQQRCDFGQGFLLGRPSSIDDLELASG